MGKMTFVVYQRYQPSNPVALTAPQSKLEKDSEAERSVGKTAKVRNFISIYKKRATDNRGP